MRKTFLIFFALTLNTALVIGQNTSTEALEDNKNESMPEAKIEKSIFNLIITANYPEAVKGLITSTEIQTTNVIRLLNNKLENEETVLNKIFELIKHILYYMQQSSDLDLTLQRIFTSMFNFLLVEKKLYSFGMIQLNEYAKLASQVYAKDSFYIDLFMNLSDNAFPSTIKNLVWNKELKCIKNKNFDEYLFQSPTQLVTGDYSRANVTNDQKWSFNYLIGVGIYQIHNAWCNCSIEELNRSPDGDVIVGTLPKGWTKTDQTISWRIELINDSEFLITNPRTHGKLFALNDFHVFNDVKYREVFITKKSNVSSVWLFVDCQ